MEIEGWVVAKPGEEAMRLPTNWYGTAFLGKAHTLELDSGNHCTTWLI